MAVLTLPRYQRDSISLVQELLLPSNVGFRPPIPDSMLLNDGIDPVEYKFDNLTTYRFRIISFAAFASFMIQFDSHDMTVIASDAGYIDSEIASQLRIAPAQRYDVLLRPKSSPDLGNYPFLVGMDQNPDYTNPDLPVVWRLNATGHLVADSTFEKREMAVGSWDPADDSLWTPYGNKPIFPQPDKVFELDFQFCIDENNTPRFVSSYFQKSTRRRTNPYRACFDDNMGDGGPYVPPKVPTLYTAATTGEANDQREVYGHIHPLIVEYGDIVDIVINNHDGAIHPFHLHGHQFQVLSRPASGTGPWTEESAAYGYNLQPPRRDTISVQGQSHAVLRFKADNPGVYLFHCHIEWHVEMGLTATVIEAPERLRNFTILEDHAAACEALGIPYAGNAGGNTVDVFDMSDYNTVNEYPYDG